MAEKSKTLFPKPIPCRTEVRFRVFRGETNLTEFVRTLRRKANCLPLRGGA